MFLVAALVIAVAGVAVLARAYTLRDSVLPGVTVAGVDVGGLAPADARARIDAEVGARLDEPVEIVVGGKSLRVTPSNIFQVDGAASERAAYDSARESLSARLGALAVPFAVHRDVQPVLRVHESGRAALADELAALTKRAVSARVSMEGKEPVVVPGREGTAIDGEAVLASLRETALAGLPSFEVQLQSVEPPISTEAAERAATTARTIAAAPVRLKLKGEGDIGRLGRVQLASLVRFEPKAGAVNVVLDPAGSSGSSIRSSSRSPEARGRHLPRLGRPRIRHQGEERDDPRRQGCADGDLRGRQRARRRLAVLGLTTLAPELTTKDAKALGIRERISTFTTDMGLSSSNRIWNVHLLGNYLEGTIVKAGETFSYNEVVGPRTIERGFREGQMIFGGVLIPSIGGGVCQTATTIFNAAFEAGLPVSERHNHSWYISHYPMGRDATVSWGGPDLVFKNDLKNAILIDVSYTDATFTISFYGTKQGRKVTSTTASPTNYTQPKMQYAIDPTAAPGSKTVVAGGGQGFDATSTARSTSTGSSSGRTTSSPATPRRTRRRCTAPAASRPVPTSSCRPAVRAVRVRPA